MCNLKQLISSMLRYLYYVLKFLQILIDQVNRAQVKAFCSVTSYYIKTKNIKILDKLRKTIHRYGILLIFTSIVFPISRTIPCDMKWTIERFWEFITCFAVVWNTTKQTINCKSFRICEKSNKCQSIWYPKIKYM